jgi:hypothetical protein
MKLFEEFKLYETMWDNLNEAKADTERLVTFAGQDLADRFLAIKDRLKSPENDLYYWIKNKTAEELAQFVAEVEGTKSKTRVKKDIADQGAELIQETEHWLVYHITTFEAAQKYGRDTRWCITGIDGYGDRYWTQYKQQGCEFYFIIAKEDYDPRGYDSKFAIAQYKRGKVEIFNQPDESVRCSEIPYVEEIDIPGVDLGDALGSMYYCSSCGKDLDEDDYYVDPDGDIYCEDCFYENCFFCDYCRDSGYLDDAEPVDMGYEMVHLCRACADELIEKEAGHDYDNLDCHRNTAFSIGTKSKIVSKYNLHVEDALAEILKFINGLTQEEKDEVSMSWRCNSDNPYAHNDVMDAYEGELIVSIFAPEELEDMDLTPEEKLQERTGANYYEAEDKIRAALGLPKKVYN